MMSLLIFQFLLVFVLACTFAAVLPPIVGGGDANIEDYRYQVSLEVKVTSFSFCGGSIVSEKFIVTAAHCVLNKRAASLKVRVGATYSGKGGDTSAVAKITIHPENSNLKYDVAVLELKTPLSFSEGVGKIDLPDGVAELEAGTIVNITGYGDTSPQKRQRLQAVQVPIVSRSDCDKAYAGVGLSVTEDMICAGVLGIGEKDSCHGDSGGPLAHDGKLYGIVSWGEGCAEPEYPGVYGNVVHLLPFIKDVTGL